jgi:glucoamylase
MDSLQQWIEQQYARAAPAMMRSVSAVDILKTRPGFGQTLRPARGSIVASPELASYDPDPDYFFHWHRDSAVVIDALRLLFEAGDVGSEALSHFADFVRFSLSLQDLDGRKLVAAPAWRANVVEDFRKFLRTDADLATVHGAAVAADTRFNPDGTLDISSWARPQHDGPAMRAVALLRWLLTAALQGRQSDTQLAADVAILVRSDLEFVRNSWREPSFDIWEEEKGQHYYTLRVSAAALVEGARWLETLGDRNGARSCRHDAAEIYQVLDGFWLEDPGHYRSRVLAGGLRTTKDLDIAVILAAIHAGGDGATHSVHDPKMHATLARLESLFQVAYPINQQRADQLGPAMGRYAGDVYYSGGAYYFSTLGAAEFCFRAAAHNDRARSWIERGDAYLETVRTFTPASGDMSEQFDQRSGEQTSARHLAWSYAAFISTVCARRAVT